jgi:metal-sulfur cluster biosynthetic enzyme
MSPQGGVAASRPKDQAARGRVLAALGTVIDPELDEPITTLRFVRSVEVSPAGDAMVRLRLPTPQCAPNFAFLMAADAKRAVRQLPGLRRVSVELEDHYTGREINAALDRDEGFVGAFPGETDDDELHALRELFMRKALIARQSRICQELLRTGSSAEAVVALHLAELPDNPQVRRCLQLREQLGIACRPDSAAFVSPGGEPLDARQLERWLRGARLIRTSLEANGEICRGLLAARDKQRDHEEVAG